MGRFTSEFTPHKENDRSHLVCGERAIEAMSYNMHAQFFGHKNSGYVITVTGVR